jgi:hypothetical protein
MPAENQNARLEDSATTQADARIRELLSTLPSPTGEARFEHRVLAKVHRRRIVIRSTCAASLIISLAVWFLISGINNPQQPALAHADLSPAGSLDSLQDSELFAAAYQGFSSPVVQLEMLESEPQALLTLLVSLEAKMENE